MRNAGFILLFFYFSVHLFSQNEGITGARAYSLAGITTLQSDVWSANNNPASLGNLEKWNAGLSYENQFLLTELSNKTVIVTAPIKSGTIAVSFNQFGYSSFNENRLGIAYGMRLSPKISMGVQLNYLNTRLGDGYGKTNALSGNIGILAKVNEELTLSTMVINPNLSLIHI